MPLIVGTDSYITLVEAEAYLADYILPTDKQYVVWDDLADSVKEIHLRYACQSIEAVKFTGKRYEEDQALSFPRTYSWGTPEEVPEAVKIAQAFEALELSSPGADSEKYEARTGVVKSYSLKGLGGETFRDIVPGSSGMLSLCIKSRRAQLQLSKLAGGGYDIT